MSELTAKQEQFCLEYLVDLNATQAAIRAGYSADSAGTIGHENIKKHEIASRIRELMKERSSQTLVDAYFVINSLIKNVDKCQQAEPVLRWNPDTRQMEPSGEWQFDSQGANRALELLGKHLGVFEKDNTQKQATFIPPAINVYPSTPTSGDNLQGQTG